MSSPYRSAEAEVDAELAGVPLPVEDKVEEEVASHQEVSLPSWWYLSVASVGVHMARADRFSLVQVLDTSAKRADDIRALVERIADSVFA